MRLILYEPAKTLWAVVLHICLIIGLCAFFVWFATSLQGAEPNYEQIAYYGCSIAQTKDFNRGWQVQVWADYKEGTKKHPQAHDYEALSSVRPSRAKAMKDCDGWMREVESKLLSIQKSR